MMIGKKPFFVNLPYEHSNRLAGRTSRARPRSRTGGGGVAAAASPFLRLAASCRRLASSDAFGKSCRSTRRRPKRPGTSWMTGRMRWSVGSCRASKPAFQPAAIAMPAVVPLISLLLGRSFPVKPKSFSVNFCREYR
jgi:hypothetical protein